MASGWTFARCKTANNKDPVVAPAGRSRGKPEAWMLPAPIHTRSPGKRSGLLQGARSPQAATKSPYSPSSVSPSSVVDAAADLFGGAQDRRRPSLPPATAQEGGRQSPSRGIGVSGIRVSRPRTTAAATPRKAALPST
eukprot:CAMPEP_0180319974 /NCGR_PEP_ID=MMETSP0988-20121125/35309_1 /TAXON_ID=697907 /ORGANISM="non described non described, Strain CCMP2293" /LENGTH=137 /DNA_ID=CAMNT_0022305637 /DNA_START=118 /DNA_END=528 /DNA_ORIENTATION=-